MSRQLLDQKNFFKMELAQNRPRAIAMHEGVEELEAAMLEFNQVECPVVHRFGPDIYIREVTLPAGIFALGHNQKKDHFNQVLSGKVAMVEDGEVVVVEAPFTNTGRPGRKLGKVLEECVWQNIYPNPTNSRDIDWLESQFLDKSDTFIEYDAKLVEIETALNQHNRDDFNLVLSEYGSNPELVRDQSENQSDQIPMPEGWESFTQVRPSEIEGNGLFTSFPIPGGNVVAPARIGGKRTPAGLFVNHSVDPNCIFRKTETGDIYLFTIKDVGGCAGGSKGEELTVDYRQSLSLSLSGIKPKEEL